MQTSEVLNRAADLIEQHGWASAGGWYGEENYGGSGVGLCLEGGIMAALGLKMGVHDGVDGLRAVTACPAYVAVSSHLELVGSDHLYDWNDKKGRTALEVIGVLRATAVIEAAREEQDAAWVTYAEQVSA